MELDILLLKLSQLFLQLVNLNIVLVLYPKVIHLDGNIPDLGPQLVILLTVGHYSIELPLQILQLLINLLGHLLLGILVDVLLHLVVHLADVLNHADSLVSDLLDVVEDLADVTVLRLQVFDYLVDPLQVLVPVHVFGHRFPFFLHVAQDSLLLFNLPERHLELFLEILDLVLLVLVLNTLVCDLLLLLKDLLVDGSLVFLPLLLQFLKLFIEFSDFSLEDSEVLACELLKLTKDLFLFLVVLLSGLQVFCQFLLLFF